MEVDTGQFAALTERVEALAAEVERLQGIVFWHSLDIRVLIDRTGGDPWRIGGAPSGRLRGRANLRLIGEDGDRS